MWKSMGLVGASSEGKRFGRVKKKGVPGELA